MVAGMVPDAIVAQEVEQRELNSSNETFEDGSYYQTHTLEGEAGQEIAIELVSSEFDAYLILVDPEGNQIAKDDDSGEGKNAKIITTLPTTGTYHIIVKTYEAGETGTYSLHWHNATQQEQKRAEADSLEQQVLALYQQGRYAEAIPIAKRSLTLRQQVLGEEHLDIAASLTNLAALYEEQGKYEQAEPLFRQVLEMTQNILGEENLEVAVAKNNLAFVYESQGQYDKAANLYRQALELFQKLLDTEHIHVARSFENLASVYSSQNRYAKAEPLYQQALEIKKSLLDEPHLEIANTLNNLGLLYKNQGRYNQAESLYQKSLEMTQSLLGEQHPKIATSLNNLAALYRSQGRYAKAEKFYRQALAMRKRIFGEQHPQVAGSLNNLAILYESQGRYAEAEPLYRQALEIYQQMPNQQHPRMATIFNNMGGLYERQGMYEQALSLYRQALDILKPVLGVKHTYTAKTLNNLAALYQRLGQYEQGKRLLLESLEIYKQRMGDQHPQIAQILSNLAVLSADRGQYEEAESLYQQSLNMSKALLGEEHPQIAASLDNLASLYASQGKYDRAVSFYQQSLNMKQRLLSEEHPQLAINLNNLATVYWAQGKLEKAVEVLRRGFRVQNQNLTRLLAVGSERQKQDYMATMVGTTYSAVSLHLQGIPNSSAAARLALTTVLRRKGRILDMMANNLRNLRQHVTPENQELLDQLADTRSQLATLLFQGVGNRSLEVYRQQVANLKAEANQLENKLSYRSNKFRSQSQPVTVEAIQEKIPDNAALLEFIRYQPYNPEANTQQDRWRPFRYAVYIVLATGEPQWLDLGAAQPIDRAIAEFRQALQNQNSNMKTVARQLDKKLMQPVRSLLNRPQHLLISPDSQLNLIPFAALVDENNRYLVRDYQITYLSSGRDLLQRQQVSPIDSPPVLVAHPDYSQAKGTETGAGGLDNSNDRRSVDLADLTVGSLPGTADEAEAIAPMFENITLLTRSQATEGAIKDLSAPKILHIATHGFFLKQVEQVAPPNFTTSRSLWVTPDPDATGAVNAENPLLRSGLALAGFNNRQNRDNQGNDGVLTALEVAGLDLYGTQLVVLSACETGVGEVKNGEGVYGLRRAVAMAGAQSQLISLWKVSDEGTQKLMTRYYQHLLSNQGRSQAYRQMQLDMLESGKYQHPYFWAAFIPSGDWTPIE